jgi:nicotinate-nucleotide adenylyltransferase
MRIGIMGGTFDPIHNGHITLAMEAYKQFRLDQIWFMPSGNPPHKPNAVVATNAQRKRMVELAIADFPYMCYNGMEMEREGYIYTADTMAILQEDYPEHSFYFILGADSLFSIEKWHEPCKLLAITHILAACRDSYDDTALLKQISYLQGKYNARIELLKITPIPYSSHEIRQWYQDGVNIMQYIPPQVAAYIKKEGIYDKSISGN